MTTLNNHAELAKVVLDLRQAGVKLDADKFMALAGSDVIQRMMAADKVQPSHLSEALQGLSGSGQGRRL